MIEINGMAHVVMTVSEWDKCRAFYAALLPFIGMERMFDGDEFVYYVGGRTALGLQRCAERDANRRFVQGELGFHHLCFRCRSREDVDAVHGLVTQHGVAIIRAPEESGWAKGYYSLLFEDPAGMRIEFNFVPGKGLFEEGARFSPTGYR